MPWLLSTTWSTLIFGILSCFCSLVCSLSMADQNDGHPLSELNFVDDLLEKKLKNSAFDNMPAISQWQWSVSSTRSELSEWTVMFVKKRCDKMHNFDLFNIEWLSLNSCFNCNQLTGCHCRWSKDHQRLYYSDNELLSKSAQDIPKCPYIDYWYHIVDSKFCFSPFFSPECFIGKMYLLYTFYYLQTTF